MGSLVWQQVTNIMQIQKELMQHPKMVDDTMMVNESVQHIYIVLVDSAGCLFVYVCLFVCLFGCLFLPLPS